MKIAVTKAYGLYHRIGLDALNIAHPATLVIDRDRKVDYIYRGDNRLIERHSSRCWRQ